MLGLLLNLAAVGLTVGSMYALIAVSFAVIFNITHTFHLAHGAVITVGGYLVYVLASLLHLPFPLALLLAVIPTALLGAAMEVWLYRPLRRAKAPPMILFLASVGLLTIFEGLIGLFFGTEALTISALPLQPVQMGPVTVTTANLAMLAGWPIIALVTFYLVGTRSGQFLRAVSDFEPVAATLGIPTDRVFVISFLLGSAIAVPAAILYSWYQALEPTMGLSAILIASAAVIIGGRHGILPGAIVALVVGLIQSLLIAVVPTGWQDGIIFALLLLAVLLRPQGIFGYSLRW